MYMYLNEKITKYKGTIYFIATFNIEFLEIKKTE